MSNPDPAQLMLCTSPDRASAEKIAGLLVEGQLAACVNIVAGVTSIYRWQGKIQSAEEHLLLVKTRRSRYADAEAAIIAAHPYEVPEIIAVSIDQGLPAYLRWIDSCVPD